ncbi:ATP-dependent helicase HrpB [hydrothermal vent metagenome]|uniref:ATP-dependent helicase HrpB n=1 Tax=hydrothermal vent metagenome TaxID=652676 RepID=A0A3B1BTQ0_9ZZZZ
MVCPLLPIEAVLADLHAALQERHEVVLEAPPGAGKTTRVPLSLLDAGWLGEQKIIMLEPRRLAARAAAEYMASTLGEAVGQTVGYRVRLENRISAQTRIEVVTEGILTRMLQNDPSLEGIGLLIFDEFHERSLDADLGLALALQGRALFREQPALKILIMSATLEGARLATLLNDAPVIKSEGRLYPVEIRYGAGFIAPERLYHELPARMLASIKQALVDELGSILVFLPGQAEIRRLHELLRSALADQKNIILVPLYGDLDLQQQRRAIEPAATGGRKIVLATDIAESSLTIEGVRIIVDSGLHRQAMFDPAAGMSRLHTRRISQASSIQRMGRAGRIEAGVCYRLWSEHQQKQLIPFTPPAIEQADLLPLALQLQRWGVDDPNELVWLDPPAAGQYSTAVQLLCSLGALEPLNKGWKLTRHGEAMARLPLHPRLAHMLLMAQPLNLSGLACDIAALLSERDPLSSTVADIQLRLKLFANNARIERRLQGRIQRLCTQSRAYRKLINHAATAAVEQPSDPRWAGFLLACAYPDRIARRRKVGGADYQMSNGRAVCLRANDPLQHSKWLVIAGLGGRQGQTTDQIYLAAEFDSELFEDHLSKLVFEDNKVSWNDKQDCLNAEYQRRVGCLVISRKPLQNLPLEQSRPVLLQQIRRKGLRLLPWNDELRNWQLRLMLLRHLDRDAAGDSLWPDVSDENLLATLETWLGPYVDNVRSMKQLAGLDLASILRNLLSWDLQQKLEQLAPARLRVPSGSMIRIDYQERPPVLAVRLQEMFGCTQTPRIANGRVTLKLQLLSPARRPIQVTQDLAGFWNSSYREVKKEMKGRYPKHNWPDDPLSAIPSARTTRKMKTRQG